MSIIFIIIIKINTLKYDWIREKDIVAVVIAIFLTRKKTVWRLIIIILRERERERGNHNKNDEFIFLFQLVN